MRWPGKREVAALVLLHEAGPVLDVEEAAWVLRERLCVTKRTARNIIKRLKRLGAVRVRVDGGRVVVEAVDPCVFLSRLALAYAGSRRARCKLPPAPPPGGRPG